MAASTIPGVVRATTPPIIKAIFPEYEIEIILATDKGSFRLAPKVQDIFAAWKAQNRQFEGCPLEICATVFREQCHEIIRECLQDPKKNYELIDRSKLPAFKAFINNDRLENSQSAPICAPGEEKPLLFVLRYIPETSELELLVSGNSRYTHASFLEGKPVAAAGELFTNQDGRIVKITTQSGHYRPEEPQTDNLVQYMTQCHFAAPHPIQFVIVQRDACCKGFITYSSLLREKHTITDSTLVVRLGKIPKILEKNAEFLSYYHRVKQETPDSEYHAFRDKFFQSSEWKEVKAKTTLDAEEYAKRRLVLVRYASEAWHAKVKEPKRSNSN